MGIFDRFTSKKETPRMKTPPKNNFEKGKTNRGRATESMINNHVHDPLLGPMGILNPISPFNIASQNESYHSPASDPVPSHSHSYHIEPSSSFDHGSHSSHSYDSGGSSFDSGSSGGGSFD